MTFETCLLFMLYVGTFITNKIVRLIAINLELTHGNHAIKYFNRLTALVRMHYYKIGGDNEMY